jgi:hypothetical protein
MKIYPIHNQVKMLETQGTFLYWMFFNALNLSSWIFLMLHPIQPFEMMDLPFNGKSAFHCKDGTQCPWLVFYRSRPLLYCIL